jgi:hypothetical protein
MRNLVLSESNSIGKIEWMNKWVNKHELTNACYYWNMMEKDRFWLFFLLLFNIIISLNYVFWLKCTHIRQVKGRRSLVSAAIHMYICVIHVWSTLYYSFYKSLSLNIDLYVIHISYCFSLQIHFNQCSLVLTSIDMFIS